jgi:ABC-type multidrug transport system fused ATPase/permease subunit
VGLSESEQKVLDELERQLTGGKAAPQEKISQVDGKVKYGRLLVLGSVLVFLGLGIMVFAISIQQVVVGVLAFLTMLTGLYLVSQNWTSKAFRESQPKSDPKPGKKPGTSGYFQNRWDQRNGE